MSIFRWLHGLRVALLGLSLLTLSSGAVLGGNRPESHADFDEAMRIFRTESVPSAIRFWESKASLYEGGDGFYESTLGFLMVEAGRLTDAKRYLQEALELGWRSPGIAMSLSTMHLLEGDLELAARWAEWAIEHYPSAAGGYLSLAEVRFAEQRWQEAIQLSRIELEVRRLKEIGASHAAYRRIGHAHMMLGEFGPAEEALGRAMQLWPEWKADIVMAFLYAEANFKLGAPDIAYNILRELVDLNPNARDHEHVMPLMAAVKKEVGAR